MPGDQGIHVREEKLACDRNQIVGRQVDLEIQILIVIIQFVYSWLEE